MPNESAPDTDEGVESLLTGSEDEPSNESALEALRPSRNGGASGKQQSEPGAKFKFIGREFASVEEAERSVKELRAAHDQKARHSNILTRLIKDPAIKRLAQTDPEVKAALREAGFLKAEKEREEEGRDEDDKEPSPVEMRMLEYLGRAQLRDEFADLHESIGRKLTDAERKEVLKVVSEIEGISVARAWKLTPAYEKQVAEKHKKALDAERARSRGNRPEPNPALLPGEKEEALPANAKDLKDHQKGAFIRQIMEKSRGQ